jgi:hypothetical protein
MAYQEVQVQSSRAGDLYFQSHRDHVARAAPTFILPSCLLAAGGAHHGDG